MLELLVTVLLAAVGISTATSGIGKCDITHLQVVKVNFDEFASTHGGVWSFVEITDSPRNSKLQKLTWNTKPTTTKGVYSLTTNFVNKDGGKGTLLKATIQNDGSGLAVAKGIDFPYTLKFYFLKYAPQDYAYFYVCADDGEENIDYRYVVSQKPLTASEKSGIAGLEAKYKFRGKFTDL